VVLVVMANATGAASQGARIAILAKGQTLAFAMYLSVIIGPNVAGLANNERFNQLL